MGEMEIKRALAFLANPRSTVSLVANWSQAQKVEFLRGKLSPADLEEALKRTSSKKEDELAQFFEMDSPVPAAVPVQRQEVPSKAGGFGIYGLVGAGLLGALTSALFFSASDPPKKKKKEQEPDPNAPGARIETAPVAFEPVEEYKETIDTLKDGQSRLTATVSSISTQLAALQKSIEAPPEPLSDPTFDAYAVHRAIASYIAVCPQEQRVKVLGSLVVLDKQMWLQNIEAKPQDKALARINVTTPKYKNEVGLVQGVETLMNALGFALNGGFWEFEGKIQALREGLRVLQEEQARARASTPPIAFSSAKPWVMSDPKREADPLPPPAPVAEEKPAEEKKETEPAESKTS